MTYIIKKSLMIRLPFVVFNWTSLTDMCSLIKIVKKWPKKRGHIDSRFKQWMNFETCTCQKYTESVQIQWIKKIKK